MIKRFSSLDQTYACETNYLEPDRYRALRSAEAARQCIAMGSGISYVAAGFGPDSTVVGLKHFDRILELNLSAHTITVEPGVTLGKLYALLSPLGLMTPVQPGHPQISIGGCIAFNVHGKNQFTEGLFETCVVRMELFHPTHGRLTLSREENPDIFALTLGGMGLTGIITQATLTLKEIPGRHVLAKYLPAASLTETLELMERGKAEYDLLYSWNDCSLGPLALGRGFVIAGKFGADAPDKPENQSYKPIRPHTPKLGRKRIFQDRVMQAINAAYHLLYTRVKRKDVMSFFDFCYPVARKDFYFDFYGPGGFLETQVLVPMDAAREYLKAFEAVFRRGGSPSYLTSMKIFKGTQERLTYNGTGLSFALDMPNTPAARALMQELDGLNTHVGAISNIAKDSRVSASTIRAQYPEYESFRDALKSFDPKRLFVSEVSRRLEL